MTTTIQDSELRRKVLAELEWDPSIDASAIGVAVDGGVVTLSGTVSCYADKLNAERAVKRVAGVKAVAEDLVTKLSRTAERTDAEVAQSVVNALQYNVSVPAEKIRATVENGWVTLDGEVEWQYQKAAAESTVRHLMGVKGLTNRVDVKTKARTADVKSQIESAFARWAHQEATRIKVEATDGTVNLRGTVHTFAAKDQAEHAAWLAAGVTKVRNDIIVNP